MADQKVWLQGGRVAGRSCVVIVAKVQLGVAKVKVELESVQVAERLFASRLRSGASNAQYECAKPPPRGSCVYWEGACDIDAFAKNAPRGQLTNRATFQCNPR